MHKSYFKNSITMLDLLELYQSCTGCDKHSPNYLFFSPKFLFVFCFVGGTLHLVHVMLFRKRYDNGMVTIGLYSAN